MSADGEVLAAIVRLTNGQLIHRRPKPAGA